MILVAGTSARHVPSGLVHSPSVWELGDVVRQRRPDTVVVWSDDVEERGFALALARRINLPVVIAVLYSAMRADADHAIAAGAHDVIVSPCTMDEILLRRHVLIGRTLTAIERGGVCGGRFDLEGLTLDLLSHALVGPVGRVSLARREMQLLVFLLRARGHLAARADLVETIWSDTCGCSAALHSTVSRLRRRLAAVGGDPDSIETLPGRGYRLKV